MKKEEANAFKEKLDEILNDTEEFVNAGKQLQAVKADLDIYIDTAASLNKNMADAAKAYAGILNDTKSLFTEAFKESLVTTDAKVDELGKRISDIQGRMDILEGNQKRLERMLANVCEIFNEDSRTPIDNI